MAVRQQAKKPATVSEAEAPKAPQPQEDVFKQKCIDLGIKLCDDVMNGTSGDKFATVDAIVSLYKATHDGK